MLEAGGADKNATCESHVLRERSESSAVNSLAASSANTLLQVKHALVFDYTENNAILQGGVARFLYKARLLRL